MGGRRRRRFNVQRSPSNLNSGKWAGQGATADSREALLFEGGFPFNRLFT